MKPNNFSSVTSGSTSNNAGLGELVDKEPSNTLLQQKKTVTKKSSQGRNDHSSNTNPVIADVLTSNLQGDNYDFV